MLTLPRDTASAMYDFEEGNLSEEDTIQLFQYLVDTGIAWQLQGWYGRTANDLLKEGLITQNGETDAEFDARQNRRMGR